MCDFLILRGSSRLGVKIRLQKVGAVLVRPDRTIAAVGFNGFPRGVLDHAERYDDRPTKYEMVVHAELNALLSSRESLEGYTLYVTPLPPCSQCAAAIIQRGIRKVVIAMSRDLDTRAASRWRKESRLEAVNQDVERVEHLRYLWEIARHRDHDFPNATLDDCGRALGTWW